MTVHLTSMATLSKAQWVDLRRIEAFHEVTLCLSDADFLSEVATSNVPAGAERKWIIGIAKDAASGGGVVAAANPRLRNLRLPQGEILKMCLRIEAAGYRAIDKTCILTLRAETTQFGSDERPDWVTVSTFEFIDEMDARVRSAVEAVV